MTRHETVGSDASIAWCAAERALPGEVVCGDLHLVKPVRTGVLLAVVDGIGHGEEAKAVARTALDTLEVEGRVEETLPGQIRRCHDALTRTRGVAMTLALLESRTQSLTWLGVGTVQGVLLRADVQRQPSVERVVLRGGMVGYRLPELRPSQTSLAPGDLLLFATDGIHPGFADGVRPGEPPQRLAERILEKHFKGTDDALVLAVSYSGPRP
jgi:serine phosphatase RsbU (regulator of sigma subunit)